jgi:hypothetical protein
MEYEGHSVEGVVEQKSIESLPTNGRSFVQLASLQPGVTVTARTQGIMNAPLGITVLGGGGQYPLVTVDGLQISDYLDGGAGGGTAVNFSNEVIQEFQLSSANFDLATPTTMQGAVNMVTKSGTNAFHGTAYFFYRDHNMAAYPALKRSSFNPNPYFARKNPGFSVNGPIIKNKLFYFGNYEYTGQTGVINVQPTLASIAPDAGIFTSPFRYNYTTVRLDYQPGRLKTNYFLRWTQDRNHGAAPTGSSAFPSNFVNLYNWSEQYALGATTVWTSSFVTELRFGFRDWHNVEQPPNPANCPGNCLGGAVPGLAPLGLPNLTMIGDSSWTSGDNTQAVQNRLARDYEPQANISWQKGKHNIKFGGDFDLVNIQWTDPVCAHGCMSVYSVENTKSTLQTGPNAATNLANYAPNLPTTVTSNAELLNLPISYPTGGFQSGFAVGPPEIPGPYEFDIQRKVLRTRVYWEDYWKLLPNLTVNFGLGYTLEGRLFPVDMPIPGLMGPAFGLAPGQTQPATPTNKKNFSPGFGFTWSPGSSGKTIIRGGAGVYWDTSSFSAKSHSLANYGPVGNGPLVIPSTLFTIPTVAQDPNPAYDHLVVQGPGGTFPALPRGAQVPTAQFSNLTLGEFMELYNIEFPSINAKFFLTNPTTSGPYQYSNVDLAKQSTAGFNAHFPMSRSYQTSIGVQHQFPGNIVVTADWAQRFMQHMPYGTYIDLNHFTEYINGVQSPVVSKCASNQVFVLSVQCSSGAFSAYTNGARGLYEGLLVSVRKSLSHRFQFTVSYAYQNLNSNTVVDLSHLDAGYGPSLAHQNVNVSGVANLWWGFDLAFNSSAITRTPVGYTTNGIDLSGTGATGSGPLPGLPVRGLFSHQQIGSAVAAFNAQYAGKIAPNGSTIPTYVLPPSWQAAGRPQVSQDFRVSKTFHFERQFSLALYGEVFNVFNIANLSGYSYTLDRKVASGTQGYALGQATSRASQVFLSSGPRAEQAGARISF